MQVISVMMERMVGTGRMERMVRMELLELMELMEFLVYPGPPG